MMTGPLTNCPGTPMCCREHERHEVIDGQRTRLAGHYFDWGADRPPSRPCHETVILRGRTCGG